jgi:hypothetical protein
VSLQVTHDAPTRAARQTTRPVDPRPKPSDRRTREQRAVREHERLVAAWLRSLSSR